MAKRGSFCGTTHRAHFGSSARSRSPSVAISLTFVIGKHEHCGRRNYYADEKKRYHFVFLLKCCVSCLPQFFFISRVIACKGRLRMMICIIHRTASFREKVYYIVGRSIGSSQGTNRWVHPFAILLRGQQSFPKDLLCASLQVQCAVFVIDVECTTWWCRCRHSSKNSTTLLQLHRKATQH